MDRMPKTQNLARSFFRKIMGYFFQGMLFLAPIGLTAYLAYWLFANTDNGINSILPESWQVPGLGILIAALCITVLGYLSSKIIFNIVFDNVDDLLERVPVVRVIYTSARDFMEAFLGKEKRFNRPVLIKMNTADDVERVGFITQTDLTELGIEGGKCAVYIPHSYNFSGNLFIVPNANVRPIEGVEASELMKFAVSGGVTRLKDPDDKDKNEKKESNLDTDNNA
jgi:uncharacterized membrane protein